MRDKIENIERLIGKKIDVLDDGFIRVIDYMGGDKDIVNAARVSYGDGTKSVSDDESLIRYLMRNNHTSPFEMCELKLHVRVPMDTWRQWIRHRTASVNEYSTRYSKAIDSFQRTGKSQWRAQSKDNKQGSGGNFNAEDGWLLSSTESTLHNHCRDVYEERLKMGVAREQARKDLPLSTYTEAYWKCNLHNLLHFLQLRMGSHAQKEIREYANAIGFNIVSSWAPMTWQAFLDYRRHALRLSLNEQRILSSLFRNRNDEAIDLAIRLGWLDKSGSSVLNRERGEFEDKLKTLQISYPW